MKVASARISDVQSSHGTFPATGHSGLARVGLLFRDQEERARLFGVAVTHDVFDQCVLEIRNALTKSTNQRRFLRFHELALIPHLTLSTVSSSCSQAVEKANNFQQLSEADASQSTLRMRWTRRDAAFSTLHMR